MAVQILEEVEAKFEETAGHCEYCIRRMRRKFSFKTKSAYCHNLKVYLAGENGEYFPKVIGRG